MLSCPFEAPKLIHWAVNFGLLGGGENPAGRETGGVFFIPEPATKVLSR
jgi:hypothetical protein